MKKWITLTVLVLVIVLGTFNIAAASNSVTVFTASFGDEAGTGSDAHGTAIVVFSDDGSKLNFKLVVNGLDNTTQSHIHVASVPGGNGPVVLWLYPNQPPSMLIPGTFNGLLGTGEATSANLVGPLFGLTLADLRQAIEEGRAYVNVHTTLFPGGEIRGQLGLASE